MVAAVHRLRVHPLAGQLARFVVVGVGNTALTLLVVWLAGDVGGLAVRPASALGYAAGMVQGYLLSRLWTFADRPDSGGAGVRAAAPSVGRSVGWQVGAFVVVNLVCGAMFTQISAWLHPLLPFPLGALSALMVTVPTSFLANRLLVFRPAADSTANPPTPARVSRA